MDRRFLLATGLAVLLRGCDRQRPHAPSATAATAGPPREVARRPLRPWPEAAAVRLFVQKPYEEGADAAFVEAPGRLLSHDARSAIEAALVVVGYAGGSEEAASCFVPHHFLRYFDDAGRRIGEIAICFCCAGVRISEGEIEMPALQGADHTSVEFTDDLARQIKALGLPTDVDCD